MSLQYRVKYTLKSIAYGFLLDPRRYSFVWEPKAIFIRRFPPLTCNLGCVKCA